MNALLIDFGASRIKSAIWNSTKKSFRKISVDAPPLPIITEMHHFELSANSYLSLFKNIIDRALSEYSINEICICSEMHGFVILNEQDIPLSNYISWKDERDTFSTAPLFPDLCKIISKNEFSNKTGMRLLPSLPIINVCYVMLESKIHHGKICSLPELLATIDMKSCHNAHITMSAGLGFYNLRNSSWDEKLVSFVEKYTNGRIFFNSVESDVVPSGYYNNIPIYTGVGDMQCAFLGAGNNEFSISLNLGTGSQVSFLDNIDFYSGFEERPYFGNKILKTITHIPSGRVLSLFANFWNSISLKNNFWDCLNSISLEQIFNSKCRFNLSCFSSAWDWNDTFGKIENIIDGYFSADDFLAGLLSGYLSQYLNIIHLLNPDRSKKILLLSGGIPHKIPIVVDYFQEKTDFNVKISDFPEETLNGLSILSRHNCG